MAHLFKYKLPLLSWLLIQLTHPEGDHPGKIKHIKIKNKDQKINETRLFLYVRREANVISATPACLLTTAMVMNRIPYDVGPRVGGDRRKKSNKYFRAWPHGVQHRHFASTSEARLISHIIGVMYQFYKATGPRGHGNDTRERS